MAITAALALVWVGIQKQQLLIPRRTWSAELYLGAISTALATYIQSKVQHAVFPERAAIIYAMYLVYGEIFAHLLLGETFGQRSWLGAALIVLAATVSKLSAA